MVDQDLSEIGMTRAVRDEAILVLLGFSSESQTNPLVLSLSPNA